MSRASNVCSKEGEAKARCSGQKRHALNDTKIWKREERVRGGTRWGKCYSHAIHVFGIKEMLVKQRRGNHKSELIWQKA